MPVGRTPAGAVPTFGRNCFSAAISSGSPATKPGAVAGHRGALRERVEHGHVRPVGELEGRDGRLVEPELGVRLVRGEHELVLARERREPLVERERGSCARRVVRVVDPARARSAARSRPGTASRSGQEAVGLEQRQLDDPRPGELRRRARRPGSRARSRRRCRGRAARSSTTCANEKIASFEPSVGITCTLGVERRAEAAPGPAGDCLAELRQARPRPGSPSARAPRPAARR